MSSADGSSATATSSPAALIVLVSSASIGPGVSIASAASTASAVSIATGASAASTASSVSIASAALTASDASAAPAASVGAGSSAAPAASSSPRRSMSTEMLLSRVMGVRSVEEEQDEPAREPIEPEDQRGHEDHGDEHDDRRVDDFLLGRPCDLLQLTPHLAEVLARPDLLLGGGRLRLRTALGRAGLVGALLRH